jgi:hypothetical protein
MMKTSCRLLVGLSAPALAVPGAREILAAPDEPIEVDGMHLSSIVIFAGRPYGMANGPR